MAAETNVITREQMAKVRELDYVQMFGENIKNLIKMLGVTRKIAVTPGTVLKQLSVTGTLGNGIVAEGDIIPLSQYETTWTPVGEATLLKWRKATTAEAITKGGYDQAVNDTDKKMVLDIQKAIRSAFVTSLGTGTGSATGTGLQAALANAWGQLQIAFEDDDVETVYFVNPQDVADYLGAANISVQTAFGFSYIENFLGLGTVIMTGAIEKGNFYATAKNNLICYYIDVNSANGIGDVFDFTTDADTGLVGIHEDANYARMQEETVAISGVSIFAEMPAGVIVGTIGSDLPKPITVSVMGGTSTVYGVDVSDIQSNVTLNGKAFSGSLKYLDGDNAIVNEWGAGHFLAITFAADNWNDYTSVKVGLNPSMGSGMVELIGHTDDLDSVFKVTDDVAQKFVVKATKGGKTTTTTYDLTGLTLEAEG